MSNKKSVVVVADAANWAWGFKARSLKKYLSDEFDIEIIYTQEPGSPPIPQKMDLYHTFGFDQVDNVKRYAGGKEHLITGITAHVWRTWGHEKVNRWCSKIAALHANSRMLEKEMKEENFHENVYYTPNGVDEDFFCRYRPRKNESKLVVSHVGKPNPRKGSDIMRQACKMAGVDLLINQSKYKSDTVLTRDQMLDHYQDVHVQLTASDMDGTPCPMLESASCGNMLISNKIGNMPEFIKDNTNGFLVGRDAHSIAEKLVWCKENMDQVRIMGENARKEIEANWTWKANAEHVRKMWREVLSKQ